MDCMCNKMRYARMDHTTLTVSEGVVVVVFIIIILILHILSLKNKTKSQKHLNKD